MKKTHYLLNTLKRKFALTTFFLLLAVTQFNVDAQTELRRPISTSSPAWVIHIDVWVNADPKKVIEIVPEDIRPYVIFNVALSVSDPGSGPYGANVNTLSIVESWVRTCAEYGVWVTIQPASGYKNNLPHTQTNDDIYEHFFKTYPNFIGYNFAEQCWGFPDEDAFDARLTLFSKLITLANKYGGYLFVSNAQTINAPQNNAVAFLKRSGRLRSAAKSYKENYIVFEKYTTSRGFYDVESTCLGTYLSGYCGNYGIRFDDCGWTYIDARAEKPFPEVLGIVPIVEHGLLTGQTVSDGPELTWTIAILGDGTQVSSDSYISKKFKTHANFTNNNLDVFRKFINGSFRIPSKEEVINRTKIAYVNNATSGTNADKYSSERSLFTGLYAMDGEYSDNNKWTKSTGRYPTIPTIFQEGDYETGDFNVVVKKTQYTSRWSNIQAKVNEFNTLFPEEYSGDIYAGRIENTWITYNPYMGESADDEFYQKNTPASGSIPFKYNTCEKMEIAHPNYSMAVITEYSNKLEIYLNNFCSKVADEPTLLREDTIKIYGATSKPTYTHTNRGGAGAGAITVADSWTNNVYTLRVKHNGPLDVTINCSGNATNRITEYPATPVIIQPTAPPTYTGLRQHEFEDFEYKNISSSKSTSVAGYEALGYSIFGSNSAAAMRKKVNVPKAGTYLLKTRYSAPSKEIKTVDLYVNGIKNRTLELAKTAETTDWTVNEVEIELNAGDNTLLFKANGATGSLYLDNIVIEDITASIAEYISFYPTFNEPERAPITVAAASENQLFGPANGWGESTAYDVSNYGKLLIMITYDAADAGKQVGIRFSANTTVQKQVITYPATGTTHLVEFNLAGYMQDGKVCLGGLVFYNGKTHWDGISYTDAATQPVTINYVALEIVHPTALSVVPDDAVLAQALPVGQTTTLKAQFTPGNTTNQAVTWSSETESVATVDASTGVVTGVLGGTAKITATSVGNPLISGDYTITVTPLTVAFIIPSAQSDDPVVSERYYNLQGQYVETHGRASLPAGMYIVKQTLKSGAEQVVKQLIIK